MKATAATSRSPPSASLEVENKIYKNYFYKKLKLQTDERFVQKTEMRIMDLVNNQTFCFNVRYRILRYDGPEDETTLVFNSEKECDIPWDVSLKDITAINQADDGTVEIEYI